MADTYKDWTTIASDLADNSARSITAQKLRDALNSFRAFGGLYVTGGASATGSLTAGTYTTITQWTGADSNGVGTTSNSSAGTITVTAAGLYQVAYSLTFTLSTGAPVMSLGVLKNSGTSPETGTKLSSLVTNGSATYAPMSHASVLSLAAGDAIKLAVTCGSGTPTVTPVEGTFYAYRVA